MWESSIYTQNSIIRRMAVEASTTRTGSDDEQEMERNWEELFVKMERFGGMFGWSTLSERVGRYLPSKLLLYIIVHTKCIS